MELAVMLSQSEAKRTRWRSWDGGAKLAGWTVDANDPFIMAHDCSWADGAHNGPSCIELFKDDNYNEFRWLGASENNLPRDQDDEH